MILFIFVIKYVRSFEKLYKEKEEILKLFNHKLKEEKCYKDKFIENEKFYTELKSESEKFNKLSNDIDKNIIKIVPIEN